MSRPAAAASGPRRVSVLGATGSVGRSTLDLIGYQPERYQVVALTAQRSADALADLARRHRAELAVVADEAAYPALKTALAGSGIEAAAGEAAVRAAAARPADWVMAAIVGAAGLGPTLEAVRQGALVALATKESLVSAGQLLLREVERSGATLLPVDSEHNAIFQALAGAERSEVERLVLTASGGPFRARARAEMAPVTPEEAVAHPNWSMGAKISVDSATMMNKGLELIEAHHLFGLPAERIDILVHPESIVHSLVAFTDGSMLAQLGAPDMRIPIAHTLGWPRRLDVPTPRLDLAQIATLRFEQPDPHRFPALRLAREALLGGGGLPTVLNAANEVAVAAFLERRLGFLDIAAVVEGTVARQSPTTPADLDEVIALDDAARREAAVLVDRRGAA
ncbi:MAG: 1-deoxy-D-xylulose-5-phosphate reductoisomerase [Geminicoccaceae bacterium]|nr:1-deoxy-D-xylulose-5-phosphate reductoisomerase [Geminicoccaceae bacterium]